MVAMWDQLVMDPKWSNSWHRIFLIPFIPTLIDKLVAAFPILPPKPLQLIREDNYAERTLLIIQHKRQSTTNLWDSCACRVDREVRTSRPCTFMLKSLCEPSCSEPGSSWAKLNALLHVASYWSHLLHAAQSVYHGLQAEACMGCV